MKISVKKLFEAPVVVVLLVVFICMSILLPILFRPNNLLPAFPFNEDSFFYFYAAKSIRDGQFWVDSSGQFINGFQPLFALLLVPVFGLLNLLNVNDLYVALRVVYAVQGIELAGLLVIFGRLVKKLSEPFWISTNHLLKVVPSILGIIWFAASKRLVDYSINGLETGLVVLSYLLIIHNMLPNTALGSGYYFPVLLGLAILVRIDILPFALVALFLKQRIEWQNLKRVFTNFAIMMLVCGWWFGLNFFITGTPVPSSGLAYQRNVFNIDAHANFQMVLNTITTSTPVSRILNLILLRSDITSLWIRSSVALVLFVLYLVIPIIAQKKINMVGLRPYLPALFSSLIYLGSLLVFYVFFWGALWYIPRYLAPLTVILNIAEVLFYLWILKYLLASYKLYKVGVLFGAGIFVVFFTVFLRDLVNYYYFAPEPITTYVDHYSLIADLPSDARIGSFQSGVLMYFRPTVINLDGKMNSAAVNAFRAGSLYDYILDKEIEYIVEWPGTAQRYLPEQFFDDFSEIDSVHRDGYVTSLWQFQRR